MSERKDDMVYKCDHCNNFQEKAIKHMSAHIKRVHKDNVNEHKCIHCDKFVSMLSALAEHQRTCNKNPNSTNTRKKQKTDNYFENVKEIKMKHMQQQLEAQHDWVSDVFEDIMINMNQLDKTQDGIFKEFLENNYGIIFQQLHEKLHSVNAYLFICVINIVCIKHDIKNNTFKEIDFKVESNTYYVTTDIQLKELLNKALTDCINNFEERAIKDSGMVYKETINIEFTVTKFSTNSRPIEENTTEETNIFRSAGSFIPTPECLKHKKHIINIQNKDNKCLLWCIIAHFIAPYYHAERPTQYQQYEHLIYIPNNVDVAHMSDPQLRRFEELNDISINVFQLKDNIEYLKDENIKRTTKLQYSNLHVNNKSDDDLNEDIDLDDTREEDGDGKLELDYTSHNKYQDDLFLPYYCSKYEPKNDGSGCQLPNLNKKNRKIYLLLFRKYDNTHFILIKDIEHFFCRQIVCPNCLSSRFDQRYYKKYQTHLKLCKEKKAQLIKMPTKGINDYIEFVDWGVTHPLSSFCCLDFETTVKSFEDITNNKTKIIKKMEANSFGIYFKTWDDSLNTYYCMESEDYEEVIHVLIIVLKEYGQRLFHKLNAIGNDKFNNNPTNYTEEQQEEFKNALNCSSCLKEFNDDEEERKGKDRKVLHHDHFTGKYIATVCQQCNGQMKDKKILPVLVHNLRGFDSHIFITALARDKDIETTVLPLSTEKFLSCEFKMRLSTGRMLHKKKYNKLTSSYELQYECIPGTDVWLLDETNQPIPIMEEAFSCVTVRFLDSMGFMNSSLDKLVENNKLQDSKSYKSLNDMKTTFKYTFNHLSKQGYDDEMILKLLSKGIYPYNYVDDFFSKILVQDCLPPRSAFASDLSTRTKTKNDIIEEISKYFKWNLFYIYTQLYTWEFFMPLYQEWKFDNIFSYLYDYCAKFMFNGVEHTHKEVYDHFFEKLNIFVEDKDDEYLQLMLDAIEYNHAQRLWYQTNCMTMMDYHHIYLTMDVMLLTDLCNNFKEFCLKAYQIEPYYKYGLPGVAWAALHKMLYINRKKNTIENIGPLGLITDDTMRLLLDSGRRGGNCQVSIRHVEAKEDENSKEEIIYIDANNLYGWAMQQSLPYDDFHLWEPDHDYVWQWNNVLGTDQCFIKNYKKPNWNKDINGNWINGYYNTPKGYFLECDIELPNSLHDYFSDYPMFPENGKVLNSEKSEWQQSFGNSSTPKLLLTLKPKKNYVCHIKLLQLGLDLGYKITKVHSITQFNERPFISDYIEMNTKFRAEAKTEFEKDLFKAMNNIIYGKMCQKKDHHFEYKFCNNKQEALRLIHRTRYKGKRDIFDTELTGIKLEFNEMTFNSPLPVACAILDLSKYLMYEFYYKCCKPHYDSNPYNCVIPPLQNCRMCYTDTDSLIIKTKTFGGSNVYKDFILLNNQYFDLTAYDDDHIIFKDMLIDEIKRLKKQGGKVIGRFKDESGNYFIKEFYGIRAKCYFITTFEGKNKSKCKGIIESITFNDYAGAFNNNTPVLSNQTRIRSRKHNIGVESCIKKAFDSYEDKRRYEKLGDPESLPYGHYRFIK